LGVELQARICVGGKGIHAIQPLNYSRRPHSSLQRDGFTEN
jgi:hypothetical protein